MNQVSTKIILVMAGLCAGIIISELIAGSYMKRAKLDKKIKYMEDRLLHRSGPRIGSYEEELGWGVKPNTEQRVVTSDFDVTYSINSQGLRDKEINFHKPDKEFRIVAMGESMVFGDGIDYGKRFTEIIEQMLNNVEVVNMGVQGFGMDQAFLLLSRNGFRYRPDAVMLFIHEDFLERCKDFLRSDVFKPRFILNGHKNTLILQDLNTVKNSYGGLYPSRQNFPPEKIDKGENNGVIKKSKLLTLTNYSIKSLAPNNPKDEDVSKWGNIRDGLAVTMQLRKDYDTNEFRKVIFLLLEKYKKACDSNKANFLVINIDNHKIEYISNFCQELGIAYLDLSDVLKRASAFKPLTFDVDPHYNEFTHRTIGEYVAEYLRVKYNLQSNANYQRQFLSKF